MTSRPIWSRSHVETPGWAAADMAARPSATTKPAARILRISAGVFSSIEDDRSRTSGPLGFFQGADRTLGHAVDSTHGVDDHELATAAVELDQWCRLLEVHVEA